MRKYDVKTTLRWQTFTLEDLARCVVSISEPPHYLHDHQCSRKRGHGEGGLFCRQHAQMVEAGGFVRVPEPEFVEEAVADA